MWHMFGGYGYPDAGWTIFGSIFMIFIPILLLIFLVWIAYAGIDREGRGKPKEDTSMHIAKDRYAKGEISKEEYDEIVKKLKET